jgi:DNA-binding HxlR family transcriptional regulator/putative sterol carrier protein
LYRSQWILEANQEIGNCSGDLEHLLGSCFRLQSQEATGHASAGTIRTPTRSPASIGTQSPRSTQCIRRVGEEERDLEGPSERARTYPHGQLAAFSPFTDFQTISAFRYNRIVAKRSYAQYCAVARALDVVGDRWTLPVIRDLSLGPQRYTDLLNGLSGIGPTLLAARLKELQRLGIVRQATLPPPSASAVYELTSLGNALRPTIVGLAKWGLNFMAPPDRPDQLRLSWHMMAICASVPAEDIGDLSDAYEFVVDDETLHLAILDGSIDVYQGPAYQPDAIVGTSLDTLIAIAHGEVTATEAVSSERLVLSGDPTAIRRCLALLTGARFSSVQGWEEPHDLRYRANDSARPLSAQRRHDKPGDASHVMQSKRYPATRSISRPQASTGAQQSL